MTRPTNPGKTPAARAAWDHGYDWAAGRGDASNAYDFARRHVMYRNAHHKMVAFCSGAAAWKPPMVVSR